MKRTGIPGTPLFRYLDTASGKCRRISTVKSASHRKSGTLARPEDVVDRFDAKSPYYTATFNLIASFGASAKSRLVPR